MYNRCYFTLISLKKILINSVYDLQLILKTINIFYFSAERAPFYLCVIKVKFTCHLLDANEIMDLMTEIHNLQYLFNRWKRVVYKTFRKA